MNINLKGGKIKLEYKSGKLLLSDDKRLQVIKNLSTKVIARHGGYLELDGYSYRFLVLQALANKLLLRDNARCYQEIKLNFNSKKLFDYQQEAINKWQQAKKWGVINFPTGSGKTIIALHAINMTQRSTLVLTPTIVLMEQWYKILVDTFDDVEIGRLGGGHHDICQITVSTYTSAASYAGGIGNRFCFLIFDEVHHVAAVKNSMAARKYIAPYRLGLTATMPDDIGRLNIIKEVSGPVIQAKVVDDLSGEYLADYIKKVITVELNDEEKAEYDHHRGIYLAYRNQLNLPTNFHWKHFVLAASSSKQGKKALDSFFKQKAIAYNCSAKYLELKKLIKHYPTKKMLIFTNDNDSARQISEKFGIQMIIHQTRSKRRKEILAQFKSGEIKQIVSSRVLNEGIDVPDAKIAVIFSGTGTVREQRQRFGRLLRKSKNDKAMLIELVTADTSETYVSARRNE